MLSKLDHLFARIAIEKKLITQDQLAESEDALRRITEAGVDFSLAQVMVEKGYIDKKHARRIRREMFKKGEVKVGGYVILGKLGRGGMGSVYKAEQIGLDRVVALKVLSARRAKDDSFVKRFVKEAKTTAAFNHPNVVQVYDADEADGVRFFAMEYVDGGSVRDLLERRGPIPESRAISIATDIAKGLDYAQRLGVVHRDIKPANILITKDGTAKLADLGLAKRITRADLSLTQSGVALGTPWYMSPEQAKGENDKLDVRSDIYSLGATLYHILVGEIPFTGPTAGAIIAQHITAEPLSPKVKNPNLSDAICEIILKMMAKAPADRYQTPEELTLALESAERDQQEQGAVESPSLAAPPFITPPTPVLERSEGTDEFVISSEELDAIESSEPELWRGAAATSRKKSRLPILIISGVAALVLISIVGVLLYMNRGTEDKRRTNRHVVKKTKTANVKPPAQESKAKELLVKALAFKKDNESDFAKYEEIIGKFNEVIQADLFSDFSSRAKREIEKLRAARAEAAQKRFVRLVDEARRLADGGEIEGAVSLFDNLPGILQTDHWIERASNEKSDIWSELLGKAQERMKKGRLDDAKRIYQAAKNSGIASISQAAEDEIARIEATELQKARAEYRPILDGIEGLLRNKDTKGAMAKCDELVSDPKYSEIRKELADYKEDASILEDLRNTERGASYLRRAVTYLYTGRKLEVARTYLKKAQDGGVDIERYLKRLDEMEANDLFDAARQSLKRGDMKRAKSEFQELRKKFSQTRLYQAEQNEIESNLSEIYASLVPNGMVIVPKGDFINRFNQKRFLPTFYIDKYEVTWEDYKEFLEYIKKTGDHSKCHKVEAKQPTDHTPLGWRDPDYQRLLWKPRHPVIGVTWFDAYAYAAWKGKRLPTDDEWVKAARGHEDQRIYPWGNEWKENACNYNDGRGDHRNDRWRRLPYATVAVNANPDGAGPYGCLNMVGNVGEWTATSFVNPQSGSRSFLVLGSAWTDKKETMRIGYKAEVPPTTQSIQVGFRCVKDP